MQDNQAQAAIDHLLRQHPGVEDSAVFFDDRHGCVAFVVPNNAYLDDISGRGDAGSTVLSKWRKTFDLSQLAKAVAGTPVGFNTLGWNSSYTRQPIPPDEIREWVETTVGEILELGPKAVYEIGCGTGMLLMRIAPRCERYVAVDFSPVVLSRLREQLQKLPDLAERVELKERKADNFDALDNNSFDTVVINSVAQYFPNVTYLTKVLEGAVNIVKPGGYVYVGDNRSLPLLPAFASSVELFQAADEITSRELRDQIYRRIEREQELVLSPAYFLSLRNRFPKISRVEIRPLRGRADNEMSRYRYEAILHVGHENADLSEDKFSDWTESRWTLTDIRSSLLQHPNKRINIKRIRNARIEKDLTALTILRDADALLTAGELRRNLKKNAGEGIHPQALIDLQKEDFGFAVYLSWAACRADGSYDACFVPAGSPQDNSCSAIDWPEPDASEFMCLANAPGQGRLRSELTSQLIAHCNQDLPKETVLRDITLVDALARTPQGGVDSRALLAARNAIRWV
jgi:SAM-dependent methyltransferase